MQLMFSIGDLIGDTFGGIWLLLDTIVFGLINSAYKIFMAIASARLLSSDAYYEIANRLYVIVGVVMLFVLSYAILKAIIDPDQATKGDFGSGTIKRVVTAVIGLAITPVLFNVLYQAQGLFLEQDVIGKVFFRMDTSENAGTSGLVSASGSADAQIKNIGGSMAAVSIWQAFFYPAEGMTADEITVNASEVLAISVGSAVMCGLGIVASVISVIAAGVTAGSSLLLAGASVALCTRAMSDSDSYETVSSAVGSNGEISLEDAYTIAAADGNFDIFLAFKDAFQDGDITYKWFISTVCGAFCLYAFASFSIDMGVRAAKLAYYQIIAPIPLIMQVLPKFKDNFHKYVTGVVTTFLEVFVRISVVYIVVYVISHLQELFSTASGLWANGNLNSAEKALAMALLILGLVIFAKSAPDLITSSLGIPKGSMNLGFRKKLGDGGYYAAKDIAKSGTRNALARGRAAWGSERNKDKSAFGKAMSALGSGIVGLGSGVGMNAYDQFFSPGHKMSMNNGDVAAHYKNVKDRLDNRYNDRQKVLEELDAATQEVENRKKAYAAELAGGDAAKISAAEKALQDAEVRLRKAQWFGRHMDKVATKFDVETTITVNLEADEAKIKLYGAYEDFKDKLRAKTGKDTAVQAAEAYKQQVDNRVIERFDSAAYQAAYQSYLASNPTASEADQALERQRLQNLYTLSDDEFRKKTMELANQRSAAKKALEAAQDAAIVELIKKGDTGMVTAMSSFVQEHALELDRFKDERVTIDGKEIRLGDEFAHLFGESALKGTFDIKASEFIGKSSFEYSPEIPVRVSATANATDGKTSVFFDIDNVAGSGSKGMYVLMNENGEKVELRRTTSTADGEEIYVPVVMADQRAKPTECYSAGDFFVQQVTKIFEKGGKVESKSSVSRLSDLGKKAKGAHISDPRYGSKVIRKQTMDKAKDKK